MGHPPLLRRSSQGQLLIPLSSNQAFHPVCAACVDTDKNPELIRLRSSGRVPFPNGKELVTAAEVVELEVDDEDDVVMLELDDKDDAVVLELDDEDDAVVLVVEPDDRVVELELSTGSITATGGDGRTGGRPPLGLAVTVTVLRTTSVSVTVLLRTFVSVTVTEETMHEATVSLVGTGVI